MLSSKVSNNQIYRLHLVKNILYFVADSLDLETLLNLPQASSALFEILNQSPEILQIYKFRFNFVENLDINLVPMNLSEVQTVCSEFVKNMIERIANLYNRNGNETDGCKTKYFIEFLEILSRLSPKIYQIVDILMLEDRLSQLRRRESYPSLRDKTMLYENPILFLALLIHIKSHDYDEDSILKQKFRSILFKISDQNQDIARNNSSNSINNGNNLNINLNEQFYEISYSSWGELSGMLGNPYQYRSRDIRHYERFSISDISRELDTTNIESNRFVNCLYFHTNKMKTMVSLRDPLLRAYTIKDIVDELATNAG